MYIARAKLFEENDIELSLNLWVHRKGLQESVIVNWSDLKVEYLGAYKDVEIEGIRVADGFIVGYSNEPATFPDVVLFESQKTLYWDSLAFEKEALTTVLYKQAKMFIANGEIGIDAHSDGIGDASATFNVIDQVIYRQHGDTESWGSSQKIDLAFPWQNVRL